MRIRAGKVLIYIVLYINATFIKRGIPIWPIYCKFICIHIWIYVWTWMMLSIHTWILIYELHNAIRYECIFVYTLMIGVWCSGMTQSRLHSNVLSLCMETVWTSSNLEARSIYQQQCGMAKRLAPWAVVAAQAVSQHSVLWGQIFSICRQMNAPSVTRSVQTWLQRTSWTKQINCIPLAMEKLSECRWKGHSWNCLNGTDA